MFKLNKRPVIVIGLIFLLSVTQINTSFANEIEVTLDIFSEIESARVFFLRDFDLMQFGEGGLLFRISMKNSGQSDKEIIGKFSVVSGNLGPLLTGETRPFTLPVGTTFLTNLDLFSKESQFSLAHYTYESATDELRSLILQTGKLPADRYDFKWEATDVANEQNYDSKIESLIIDNPTSLDLISPGAEASFGDLPILFINLPYFRWESNAAKFQLTVCEKLDFNSTPEEVMQNTPRLQTTIENSKYFQYPAVGARLLEEGKTYYWQIVALIQTSAGKYEIPSEIWGFQLASLGNSILSAQQMQVVANLRNILGDSAVELLFGPNGELNGFEVTGVALFNGKRISLEEIAKLIEDIVAGKLKVKEMKVLDL